MNDDGTARPNIEDRVGALEARVNALERNRELEVAVAGLVEDMTFLRAEVNQAKDDIARLRAQLQNDVATLRADIDLVRRDITGMRGMITLGFETLRKPPKEE